MCVRIWRGVSSIAANHLDEKSASVLVTGTTKTMRWAFYGQIKGSIRKHWPTSRE